MEKKGLSGLVLNIICLVLLIWTIQGISDFSRCSLKSVTPQQQRDMFQCFTQCLHNPCCRVVTVKDGCEQSYVETEEMDFTKRVSSTLKLNLSLFYEKKPFLCYFVFLKLARIRGSFRGKFKRYGICNESIQKLLYLFENHGIVKVLYPYNICNKLR